MRPYAALVGGIADHHVVQPGVRHEAELGAQCGHAGVVQIDALDQQRPGFLLERGQCLAAKRAVAQPPGARGIGRVLNHQARLDVVSGGQIKKLSTVYRWRKAFDGITNEQRLFLPVALHELGGCDAA